MYKTILIVGVSLFIGIAPSAHAECDSGKLTAHDTFPTPVINANVARLHFLASNDEKKPHCPSRDKSCELPEFVVAGDEVLVTQDATEKGANQKFVCAHFISPKGKTTSGWLDNAALTYKGDSQMQFNSAAAYGNWVNGNTTITFSASGHDDFIFVEGDALNGPPAYNSGAFSGHAFMSDNNQLAGYDAAQYRGDAPATEARTSEEGCRVRFRFSGHYLLVDDNGTCGGNGVSFTGIYAKSEGQR